jgi:ubiquinone biosynthesis protein UbiJ
MPAGEDPAVDPRGLAQIAAELDALRDEVAELRAAIAALGPPKPGL